ncbi:MAG: cation-transporting P-type ATPase, partial [Eubacteriaceae bacterium]
MNEKPPWQSSSEEILDVLKVNPEQGLNREEVEESRKLYGSNMF